MGPLTVILELMNMLKEHPYCKYCITMCVNVSVTIWPKQCKCLCIFVCVCVCVSLSNPRVTLSGHWRSDILASQHSLCSLSRQPGPGSLQVPPGRRPTFRGHDPKNTSSSTKGIVLLAQLGEQRPGYWGTQWSNS